MATTVGTSPLSLGPRSNGLQLTPWEFDAAQFEAGWRYELINGVLIVNPSPLRQERDPNEELGRWLRNYQEDNPKGRCLDLTLAEETLMVGPHRRRVDRVIWVGLGRLPNEYETPAIAIKFVSEGPRNQERDYEIKRNEYRAIGVREYWIIDRFEHTMTVCEFAQGRVTKKTISGEETYECALLPGFSLSLARLFHVADRHNQ
jgi:Uma2 family endonuclease